MKRFEYMYDCIHLHACRRVQNIAKKKGFTFARHCDEKCEAYQSGGYGNYITVDECIEYARDGADSIRSGYSEYSIYAACDLNGRTIAEIIDEESE